MNRSELRQLRHNDTGLPLGLSGGAMLRYRPNPKTGWRAGHHVAIAGTRAGKGVSVVIPATIYVFAVPVLGMYVSSGLLIAAFMKWLGRYNWLVVLAVAIVVPVIIFIFFERWFLVPLPKGPLEDWLGL